jgi:hypothetical protein
MTNHGIVPEDVATAFRKLATAPIGFAEAAAFVRKHHRHHTPPAGHKFSIAAMAGEHLVGVVIVGRPVARRRDDGRTLEVTRLCTYTLKSEPGTSLRAAGWRLIAETPGKSWSVPSRPRADKHPIEPKLLWEQAA